MSSPSILHPSPNPPHWGLPPISNSSLEPSLWVTRCTGALEKLFLVLALLSLRVQRWKGVPVIAAVRSNNHSAACYKWLQPDFYSQNSLT